MTSYAIGDVHGSYEKLLALVESHRDSQDELIFLGDLFDRAPEPEGDRKVLHLIRDLQQNPKDYGLSNVVVLRGNHEQLILKSFKDLDFDLWFYNGGDSEFADYLYDNPTHLAWLADLPFTTIRNNYLCVHAGVRPGVALKDQDPDDLVWIRPPTDVPHNLGMTVVYGHSFHEEITEYEDRICIDTGACFGGPLSEYALTV
tara:strand:- start:406 stop:1008 length:603 start_codon:yes stop_codon:yes gene_type:complete